MRCQDRHEAAVTKEKPKNQRLVVFITGATTDCMKQKQPWYLHVSNHLKPGCCPQARRTLCAAFLASLRGLPRQGLLEQQECAPTAGACLVWAVSSWDLLAGRSSSVFKAVFDCSVKYWPEMPFTLLVLVLCMEFL